MWCAVCNMVTVVSENLVMLLWLWSLSSLGEIRLQRNDYCDSSQTDFGYTVMVMVTVLVERIRVGLYYDGYGDCRHRENSFMP